MAPAPGGPATLPGLVDLQINGLAGVHFGDPTLTTDAVRQVSGQLRAAGVTQFLPTLITDAPDRLTEALRRLAAARREDPALRHAIPGVHLEGPFIAPDDGPRGAHPLAHVRPPDWDLFQRWQEAAEGGVRLVTLAPEWPQAPTFIANAVAAGVLVAIGHTAATAAQIAAAVDAGATLSTHLGNGCHDTLHRHHNPLWPQLDDDRLTATVIADGHHLPNHLLRVILRAKGSDRLVLVSDAVRHARLPPGVYPGYAPGQEVEVRADGFVGVRGEPRLAGSGILLPDAVRHLRAVTSLPTEAVWRLASDNPRRLLGLSVTPADMVPAPAGW